MKRPILIIISAILVLVLLAIWIYLLFFKKPANDDKFTNLNFDNTEESIDISDETELEEPIVVTDKKLVQLTTEPTIGYQEIFTDASSTPKIYYVRSGTGHIFSIDLISGEEQQLTNTTISLAREAAITEDGQYAMIASEVTSNRNQVVVGTIDNDNETLIITNLDESVTSFKSTPDNTFLYTTTDNYSVTAKEYFPKTNTTKTIFTIPFREARVVWGDTAKATHFVYPKATRGLEGYGYSVRSGKLIRLPISGYGLTINGVENNEFVIYNKQHQNQYKSFLYIKETENIVPLSFNYLPEKCVNGNITETLLICAQSAIDYDEQMPDSWYQGDVSFSDSLWKINFADDDLDILDDISALSGRELDIINPVINQTDERYYFINKNNQTLWLYKLNTVSN